MAEAFSNIEEVLDFAIGRELEASEFYIYLAEQMSEANVRGVFLGFAQEELGHKAKLEAVKRGDLSIWDQEEPPGLDIADYVEDVEISPEMSYVDALVVAMKKEKAAYRLYIDLAAEAPAAELTDMFLALASEEAKHKLRFELEYDAQLFGSDDQQ